MNGLNFSTIHFNAEDGSHGGSTIFDLQSFMCECLKSQVCIHCMYVCMYVNVRINLLMFVCMYVCMYICVYIQYIYLSFRFFNSPGAKLTGRNGADLYISVPVGTIVSERIPDEGMNYDEVVDEVADEEEENDEDTKDLDLNQVRFIS